MNLRVLPLLLAMLGACGSDPAPPGEPALQKVRLALNWYPEPEFGGFYEAALAGHYTRAGFDVEIVPGGPGAPTLELLSAGRAEVAVTAADDLLLRRNKGIAAIGVWAAFQDTPMGLMVREGAGLTRLEDVGASPGRQVAIEIGSPFQTFLWKRFGWDGVVAPVPYGGSVGPFLAGQIDVQQAYITSEPCVARAKGAEVRFLQARESGWNPYGSLLAVADPPPAWTGAFVAATQLGWQDYLSNPDRANAHIASLNPALDLALLGCITDAQRPFVTGDDGLGAMEPARWRAMAEALAGIGLLPADAAGEGAWADGWPGGPAPGGAR